jgi:hypothetical protein
VEKRTETRTETWADIAPLVPAELAPFLLDFAWDLQRLWALDLPVEHLPVPELEWLLDAPLWRGADGRPFTVRPRDVLREPDAHPWHRDRIASAELGYPIDVTRRGHRWTVLDGTHRLARAIQLGSSSVAVRKVPHEALGLIAA